MVDKQAERVLTLLQVLRHLELESFVAAADIGVVLLEVVGELGEPELPAWIKELRKTAKARGITPLSLDYARRCMNVAGFRQAAGTRFDTIVGLGISHLRPIVTLPVADIDDLVRNGIPTPTGRVAIENATVTQIKDAAKAVRARIGTSGSRASTPASEFEKAMAVIEKLAAEGKLTAEQKERMTATAGDESGTDAKAAPAPVMVPIEPLPIEIPGLKSGIEPIPAISAAAAPVPIPVTVPSRIPKLPGTAA